ncbi:hypothetical protein [Dickeya sp. MK7]|uniref:hypothetical protein n=1 Tax=Dickeya sp. MK7 TaxID=1224145 RepID=UPI000A95CBAD|nr:hypothetical protein [Dickeya sp. MK7]
MPKQSTTPNGGSTTTGANGRSGSAGDNSIFSPLGDNVYLNKISSVLQDFLAKAGQITHGTTAFNAAGSPKKTRRAEKRRQTRCRGAAGNPGKPRQTVRRADRHPGAGLFRPENRA